MIQIQLEARAFQSTTIILEKITYIFEFRFLSAVQIWVMSIFKDDEPLIKGAALTLSKMILNQQNFPFDVFLVDNSKTGIDPFKIDDFNERINIYLLNRDEVTELRGYEVR
jgi:hypothetical protein